MRNDFSSVDLKKKKGIHSMPSQHSEPNLHSTHFHVSIEGCIVLWPQKGEIGERIVSGELGE